MPSTLVILGSAPCIDQSGNQSIKPNQVGCLKNKSLFVYYTFWFTEKINYQFLKKKLK